MKLGDLVVMIGGLYGVVLEIDNDKWIVVLDCEGIFFEYDCVVIKMVKLGIVVINDVIMIVEIIEELVDIVEVKIEIIEMLEEIEEKKEK